MTSSSSHQGIALLGAGIFATESYIPALANLSSELSGTVRSLKAVYSRSQKSSEQLAATASAALPSSAAPDVYYDSDSSSNDLKALLARSDIDLVLIVLPITIQPQVILAALEAGKHVLSEKPVAANVRRGLDLLETYNSTYKSKGLVWRVAENFEAEPVFQRAAKLVRTEDAIGKISTFKVSSVGYIDETSKYYNTPWRTIPDYQGGFLLDGGVHQVAALRTILPAPLTHISSFASLNKEILKPQDTIHAIAKSNADFHGIVEISFSQPTKTKPVADTYLFTGSKGWLAINMGQPTDDGGKANRITLNQLQGSSGEGKTTTIDEKSRGVEEELKSFFDAVDGKPTEAVGDPLGALRDVAFIQAALTSAGELVSLDALLSR